MKFLPPNTTSIIQLCDHGIIKNLKSYYRSAVVKHIIASIDNLTSANELAKKLTLLDAAHFIVKSWNDVTAATIANCFKKAGCIELTNNDFEDNSDYESDSEDDQTPDGMTNTQFQAYVNIDCSLECFGLMSYNHHTCDNLQACNP